MVETSNAQPHYLTRKEAVQLARCSYRTIQRWQEQGKLRRCGIGRPLVDRYELEQFLAGPLTADLATPAQESQSASETHKGPKTPDSGQTN